eukprot:Em0004g862a
MDAQQVADKFEGAFARLGACHSIYDQCFVTDEKCAELDKAIVCIMDYFGTNFPNEISPPKCTYWRITQWSGITLDLACWVHRVLNQFTGVSTN